MSAEPGGFALPARRLERLSIRPAAADEVGIVERYAADHPGATLYHRPAVLNVVERCGLESVSFVARRSPAGPVVGILPVALTRSRLFGTYATSLPFFNYGGVLADDEVAARALVEATWEWAAARGAAHLVLRHGDDRVLDLPASRHKETVLLSIPAGEPEALWDAIGPKPRNLVRKAERSGLAVESGGAPLLGAFHDVYATTLRDLGTPSLGRGFFAVLFEELGSAARVHLVRAGAVPVAAAVTLRFRDRVEVPWAGSLRSHRAFAPNMLLYWNLLETAARTGARVFDFGRSTPGSGPYRFKLQWRGAEARPLAWYFVSRDGDCPAGDLSPANPRYRYAIAAWKRLPVAVARRLGAVLSRSLP